MRLRPREGGWHKHLCGWFPSSLVLSFHSNLCFALELGAFDPQQSVPCACESGNRGCPSRGHNGPISLWPAAEIVVPVRPKFPLGSHTLISQMPAEYLCCRFILQFSLSFTAHIQSTASAIHSTQATAWSSPQPQLRPLWFLPRIIASSSVCSPGLYAYPLNPPPRLQSSLSQTHTWSFHCPVENLPWLSIIFSVMSKDLHNLPSVYLSGLIFCRSPFAILCSGHTVLLIISWQSFSFTLLCLLYTFCPQCASLYPSPLPG